MAAPSRTDTCPVDHSAFTTGETAHHGYEPFDMNDPFPAYERLRKEEPVMYDERVGLWVVTRWADVRAAFDDDRLCVWEGRGRVAGEDRRPETFLRGFARPRHPCWKRGGHRGLCIDAV